VSFTLNIAGVDYNFPSVGDAASTDWGADVGAWATAVTGQLLTKAGGSYQLTAELEFGALFGVRGLYFSSRNASAASAGGLCQVPPEMDSAPEGRLPSPP